MFALVCLSQGLPFGTSVYYTIVTMATVGYGDISVTTSIGRFVVCCVIIASFVWLPMEINKLTQVRSSGSQTRPPVMMASLVADYRAAALSVLCVSHGFGSDRCCRCGPAS